MLRLAACIFSGALAAGVAAAWAASWIGADHSGGLLLGMAFGAVGSLAGGLFAVFTAE